MGSGDIAHYVAGSAYKFYYETIDLYVDSHILVFCPIPHCFGVPWISSEPRQVHCNFNFFQTVELTFLYHTVLLDAFLGHPVFLESLVFFFFSCHLTAPYFYWLPNVTDLIFIVLPVS